MAAHRCSLSAVLLLLCGLSVFIAADNRETTVTGDQHGLAVDNPQTATGTAGEATEQPAAEEERSPEDAPASVPENTEHTLLSPVPKHKDEFQEEMVIRPLHSGDIYASFQFRTLWETDFRRGHKGELIMLSVAKY